MNERFPQVDPETQITGSTNRKTALRKSQGRMNDSGNNLLSHLSALSSALATLTIEFGMDRVFATRYGHRKIHNDALSNVIVAVGSVFECLLTSSE